MKTSELTAGTVYACRIWKYTKPHPVRLLSAALWRSAQARTDVAPRFELAPGVQRPTAFVGMLIVRHTDTRLISAEAAAALAELPDLDLTAPASFADTLAELRERVATWQACLPEGMQLGVVDNRNLVRTWADWQTLREQSARDVAELAAQHDHGLTEAAASTPAAEGDRLHDALDTITEATGVHFSAGGHDRDGAYARLDVAAAEQLAAYVTRTVTS